MKRNWFLLLSTPLFFYVFIALISTEERESQFLTDNYRSKNRKISSYAKSKIRKKEVTRKREPLQEKEKKKRLLDQYFDKGEVLHLRKDYLVAQGLKALYQDKFNDSLGTKVYTRFGYVFYEPKDDDERGAFVIKDMNNGMVGLLTGKILVKIKNKDILRKVLKEQKLKVVHEFPHIHNYHLSSTENSPVEAFSSLQKTEGVDSAEMEVIMNLPLPK